MQKMCQKIFKFGQKCSVVKLAFYQTIQPVKLWPFQCWLIAVSKIQVFWIKLHRWRLCQWWIRKVHLSHKINFLRENKNNFLCFGLNLFEFDSDIILIQMHYNSVPYICLECNRAEKRLWFYIFYQFISYLCQVEGHGKTLSEFSLKIT